MKVIRKNCLVDTDNLQSDSSGNQSDNDEVNQVVEIQKLKKLIDAKRNFGSSQQNDSGPSDMGTLSNDDSHSPRSVHSEQQPGSPVSPNGIKLQNLV